MDWRRLAACAALGKARSNAWTGLARGRRWAWLSIAMVALAAPMVAAQGTAGRSGPADGHGAGAAGHGTGTVIGTVVDANGNTVDGAAVTLTAADGRAAQTATADEHGFFRMSVEPGRYAATVTSPGLAPWTSDRVMVAVGEFREIAEIVLKVPPALAVVRVTPRTEEQIAEEQIHAQERQRIVGILPNFYVSYVPHAAPLTARQKFELAWKNSTDPGSFAADGITAGVEQAQHQYPAYGGGVQGYAQRFGAAYGNDVGSTFIAAAILPAVLRQDPRYFYRGTGSVGSRVLYAISTIAICRGDNGRWQPNTSFVLGTLASGALSNVYYPAGNRGWATTLRGGALSTLQGISGRLLQEFVMKRVSRGVPKGE